MKPKHSVRIFSVVLSVLLLAGLFSGSVPVSTAALISRPNLTDMKPPTLTPYPVRAYLPFITIPRDPIWGLSHLGYVVMDDPTRVTATLTVTNSGDQTQPDMSIACSFFPANLLATDPPLDDTRGFVPGWLRDFSAGETRLFTQTLRLSFHPPDEPALTGICLISNFERNIIYSVSTNLIELTPLKLEEGK